MVARSLHPVDIHVGKQLKKRRIELGITQEILGESVNLTFQQIQKYEKGFNRISCSKLFEFSKFLRTKITYFFEGIDNLINEQDNFPHPNFPDMSFADSFNFTQQEANDSKDELRELLSYFQTIDDPEVKKRILELVKCVSKASLNDNSCKVKGKGKKD